jgi:hypothetical protein
MYWVVKTTQVRAGRASLPKEHDPRWATSGSQSRLFEELRAGRVATDKMREQVPVSIEREGYEACPARTATSFGLAPAAIHSATAVRRRS